MDTKPGWATTEFWVTVLTGALAAAVLANSSLDSDKLSALVPMAALLMAGAASWAYSHSRAKVKVAAVEAKTTTVNIGGEDGMSAIELCVIVAAACVVLLTLHVLGAHI